MTISSILALIDSDLVNRKLLSVNRIMALRTHIIKEKYQLLNPKISDHELKVTTDIYLNILVNLITIEMPSFILIELGNDKEKWENWIPFLKVNSATRRTPIICIYPDHLHSQFTYLCQNGVDELYALSSFFLETELLLNKWIKVTEHIDHANYCNQPLAKNALLGIEAFNRREFFQSHKLIEEAWIEDSTPGRNLYQALIQISVAYYHIQNQNYRGAIKMFLRLRQWLLPLPEFCKGICIGLLREDVRKVEIKLQELGPENIAEFNPALFKPIIYYPDLVMINY